MGLLQLQGSLRIQRPHALHDQSPTFMEVQGQGEPSTSKQQNVGGGKLPVLPCLRMHNHSRIKSRTSVHSESSVGKKWMSCHFFWAYCHLILLEVVSRGHILFRKRGKGSGNFYSNLLHSSVECGTNHSAVFCHMGAVITTSIGNYKV